MMMTLSNKHATISFYSFYSTSPYKTPGHDSRGRLDGCSSRSFGGRKSTYYQNCSIQKHPWRTIHGKKSPHSMLLSYQSLPQRFSHTVISSFL